jgi:hypothetical protein
MIDEKKLIEELKERERKHICDFDVFNDAPEAQFDVAHCLQELQEIMDIVRAQPKVGEWIPCSERLPEDFEKVLTCDKYGNRHVMAHFHLFEVPFSIYQNDTRYHQPVAWMPLPEPYRKGVE